MRVGLNLIFLCPGATGGMETYARELIRELREVPDLDLVAFVNREAAASGFDLCETVELPFRATSRAQWVMAEQQALPPAARRAGVAVVHSLGSTAPWWGSFARVTTVHDLLYRVAPEAHAGIYGLGMRVLIPAAVRRSHHVVAVSQQTRADLVRLLGTPTGKITVIPEGVRLPLPAEWPIDRVRRDLALEGRQVLLSLSAKRRHKNLERLLVAHAGMAPPRPVLVLPGYPTPHEEVLRALATRLGIADDVRFLGWVDDQLVETLYAVADMFIFPSLYEGFGLPVLEAMARGVPVATSGSGSLAEVAGDAALRFDPMESDSIRTAIEALLNDPELRRRHSELGRARAREFSWSRAAQETAGLYRALVESRS